MNARFSAVGSVLACAALGALVLGACNSNRSEEIGRARAAITSPAPSSPVRADGLLPGMARFHGGPSVFANPTCPNPALSYFGGPLVQSPVIVAVFWTSSVDATLQANIGQFYADVTQSPYWSWLQEYDSVGLTPGSEQAILPGTFAGSFVITPLQCAPGGKNCMLTDDDVQAELTRQINLGVLPAPTLDCTGNVRTVYMVHYPPNIRLTGPMGQGTSCVNKGFCGYHYTGTFGPTGTPLVYASLMDVFTGPCALGCGGNANPLDDATALSSHELAEATTDADIGLDMQPSYAFPAGWGDNAGMCGEIADICDDGSPGDTIVVSGRSWVVQELWSNQQQKCTSTGPVPPVCSGTTLTGCRKCSCGDDGGACNGSTSVCETSSSNVLYGACEQCTTANDTCTAGGGTCEQSATPAEDDICLGCVPITACPAGDDCGTIPDGCGGVLSCGTCAAPKTCGGGTPKNPNQCGCTPTTQCPPGQNCGTAPDGCGGVIPCGTCTAPATCGGGGMPGVCGVMPCVPKSCMELGFDCGPHSDECGNIVQCGTCTPPATCGGGGMPGVCGVMPCLPKTCPELGFNCGSQSDGCGGTLDCGTCLPPATCGGGGKAGVCGGGCTPHTCAQQNLNCGLAGDGCGNELNCGTCAAPDTCVSGQCVCTPTSCTKLGATCGTLPDGCGGMLDCGQCMPPATCGGAGQPNQCGCTPITCPPDFSCGELSDGCGGILGCGSCAAGDTCVANQCVPEVGASTTSSSTSSSSGSEGAGGGSSSASSGTGGGEGAWIPIWGRAGCAVSEAPREEKTEAPAFLLLAALGGLARVRRRRSSTARPSKSVPRCRRR